MRQVFKALVTTSVTLAFTVGLAACGGSGDSNSTPNSPGNSNPDFTRLSPALTEDGLAIYGDLSVDVNTSAGFVVLADNGASLTNIAWQQTTGPSVTLLSSQSQAIGFDVPEAGDYSFTVTATTSAGDTRSASVSLTANDNSTDDIVNLRLDHMATERGRISIRIDSPANKIITATQWTQLAGPEPDEITYQEDSTNGPFRSAFMEAPEVSRDEVMAFRVTATFDDGATASDDVLIGVKEASIANNGIFTGIDMYVTTDLRPFNQTSPYADALQACVYNNTVVNSCDFDTLPLIGMETMSPSIDTILDRTLVSHHWMGERFREFLTQSAAAEDIIKLLRGVTAVVISYDVRPSFYWVRTGAIYLDARNFWRTPEERDTLNTIPDYRSGFGNELQFGIYWRYVKDGEYYYPQSSLAASSRQSKSFAQLEASLAWLMYHELAHANDFFPPASWASISSSSDPLSHFQRYGAQSSIMSANYPLQSTLLEGLAEVSFGGEEATTAQKNTTPSQVADAFSADIAPTYYAYYTEREDYAMMFEQFMMLYRMNVSADVAVIGRVNNNDALVTWGQRHRINQDTLQARTAFTVERILPELNVTSIQAELPAVIQMPSGQSWFDLVQLEGEGGKRETTGVSSKAATVRPPLRIPQFERHLH